VAKPAPETVDELVDRLRLVAGRLEWGDESEVRHGTQEYHPAGSETERAFDDSRPQTSP
jgi:hypothetical protein